MESASSDAVLKSKNKMKTQKQPLMSKLISKENALELFKTQIISGSISFSVLGIFLLLLWHWQYHTAFWIFLGLGILGYTFHLFFVHALSKLIYKI